MMNNKALMSFALGLSFAFPPAHAMQKEQLFDQSSPSYIQQFTQNFKQVINKISVDKMAGLAKKVAIIGISTTASNTVREYFGDALQGYAISAVTNLFLLTLIQMYECYRRGDFQGMIELKTLLPRPVLTESYWSKNKLLTLLAHACNAGACVAGYVGISSMYPVSLTLFIQALLYDDALKESTIANIYSILTASSVHSVKIGISELPRDIQDTISNLSPDKVYDFLLDFMIFLTATE